MQHFEYAVKNVAVLPTDPRPMENVLNEMARDGWELDKTIVANTNPSVLAFIFRRAVPLKLDKPALQKPGLVP